MKFNFMKARSRAFAGLFVFVSGLLINENSFGMIAEYDGDHFSHHAPLSHTNLSPKETHIYSALTFTIRNFPSVEDFDIQSYANQFVYFQKENAYRCESSFVVLNSKNQWCFEDNLALDPTKYFQPRTSSGSPLEPPLKPLSLSPKKRHIYQALLRGGLSALNGTRQMTASYCASFFLEHPQDNYYSLRSNPEIQVVHSQALQGWRLTDRAGNFISVRPNHLNGTLFFEIKKAHRLLTPRQTHIYAALVRAGLTARGHDFGLDPLLCETLFWDNPSGNGYVLKENPLFQVVFSPKGVWKFQIHSGAPISVTPNPVQGGVIFRV